MKWYLKIILPLAFTILSCNQDDFQKNDPESIHKGDPILESLLKESLQKIRQEEYDTARIILSHLRTRAEEEDDSVLLSSTFNNLGLLNYRQGKFDQSILAYEEALLLDKALKDSIRIGIRLKNIGISYKQMSNYQQAVNYYRQALNLAEHSKNLKEKASINNSIGNVYNSLKDFEAAKPYFLTARSLWHQMEDSLRISIAINNLGNTYLGLNDFQSAIESYKDALDIKMKLGNNSSISITLNNLGEAFLKKGDLTNSRAVLLKSLRLKEEVNEFSGIGIVSNNLAKVDIQEGKLADAQKWLIKSLETAENIGATNVKVENLKLQRELYLKSGDFKRAMEVDSEYDEIRQSTFDTQVIQVQELQFQFDLDREEKEKSVIQSNLLESRTREENQRIKGQIQTFVIITTLIIIIVISYLALKLRKKNNHIENLMRELHHRVKNHLGMISGMFGAQTEQGTLSSADLLEEAKTRVEAVNGIHRRLYRQDEYEFVNMQEYLTELVDNSALVFGLYQSIQKELNIDSEPLEIDKAISVGLIANEVLTNSFKYGLQNTEKPLLKIVLEKAVKGYRMVIFNNAAPGQKPITESTGFGKELIKRLTANLKGESKTTQQNGFQFELTFP
ncbi:MAG: tetratricopeptide repeat protein [Roseivirga sp.]|nr:tetratricopeptide repeat protein [Roseivirga sp.]